MPIAEIKGFLLDMDGVLYHGERALPHAAEFMRLVSGRPHCFITNNPVLPPARVAEKLARLGIAKVDAAAIVTSAQATAAWLAREKADFRYFAVGGEGLHEALAAVGREDAEKADFVVVGEGALDFEAIVTGINLIFDNDARLVGTNPDGSVDAFRDGRHVVLPGGGALIAPFVEATGRQPIFIGKPNAPLYEMALARLGLAAGDCMMIGDRPDTDIVGAQRLGMKTALVRSGRFRPGKPLPHGMAPPDIDVTDLERLASVLREQWGVSGSSWCDSP